jgi:hypothetical protein
MRYLIAVLAVGSIISFLVPRAVLLVIHAAPPPQVADGGRETLDREARDREAVQNAVGAGKLHEDPQRRALRQAVLNAANRAEHSPCDTRQRQALSDAFDAYRHHREATAEDRVETLTLPDGRVIDVSRHFDDPVEDAWRFALTAPCEN